MTEENKNYKNAINTCCLGDGQALCNPSFSDWIIHHAIHPSFSF